jgi:hypothetical protein
MSRAAGLQSASSPTSPARGKFQGETLDFVWFDEEPPAEIYLEGLTARTKARLSVHDREDAPEDRVMVLELF